MQIGSRFTEYGLTGGFFWICQLFFLWYSGQAKTLLSYLSSVQPEQVQQIPSWVSQIGSTAISALAIIAVFVAGLLLDLLAVYFRPWEMQVLNQHLVRNRDWLGRLIKDHEGYCAADYEEFERLNREIPVAEAGFLSGFRFWNREQRRQDAARAKQNRRLRKLMRPYERLWSFFTSYVLVQSGSSQLSLMVDQYYLWRAGRAVSVSLAILMCEVWFLNFGWPLIHLQSVHDVPWLVPVFQLALTFAAIAITKELYSRLCFTLFGLVYVTQGKRNAELA